MEVEVYVLSFFSFMFSGDERLLLSSDYSNPGNSAAGTHGAPQGCLAAMQKVKSTAVRDRNLLLSSSSPCCLFFIQSSL